MQIIIYMKITPVFFGDRQFLQAETCCHLVTLNKINIHNTRCLLTCESLLLTCIHRTQRG